MKETILSSGIVLRPYRRADTDVVHRAVDADRERLGRFMPWVWASTTRADTERFITGAEETNAAGTTMHCGLFDGDTYVGSVGAGIDRLNGTCEAGYWLVTSFEGRGIVTEAMGVLIDELVASGVRRVVLRAAVGNARSRRVAERLGFTLEGIERQSLKTGDEIHDTAVYSLLAPEWRGAPGRDAQ